MDASSATPEAPAHDGPLAVFAVFLRLGLTSFGGPIAHLGYFRAEFVARRRWLGEHAFADLVGLCQFLPGPASSQVGIALGLLRAGWRGALAAWAGFTLPSALAMALFALGLANWGSAVPAGLLHGLKLVAVAVVAQAVWAMARQLCTDAPRATLAVAAACAALLAPGPLIQVGVIAAAAVIGLLALRAAPAPAQQPLARTVSRPVGAALLVLFFALLLGLPLLASLWPNQALALVNAFYRAGSLVFGGGHVVLPLLQATVVHSGWVGDQAFLAGYGAAQAVPGPLFSFSAFLGASMRTAPSGWAGAALALVSIYLPSFLLVLGTLPFWDRLRGSARTRSAMAGINAAVVGLLLAALYALAFWRLPPWVVVVASGIAGWLFGLGA